MLLGFLNTSNNPKKTIRLLQLSTDASCCILSTYDFNYTRYADDTYNNNNNKYKNIGKYNTCNTNNIQIQ